METIRVNESCSMQWHNVNASSFAAMPTGKQLRRNQRRDDQAALLEGMRVRRLQKRLTDNAETIAYELSKQPDTGCTFVPTICPMRVADCPPALLVAVDSHPGIVQHNAEMTALAIDRLREFKDARLQAFADAETISDQMVVIKRTIRREFAPHVSPILEPAYGNESCRWVDTICPLAIGKCPADLRVAPRDLSAELWAMLAEVRNEGKRMDIAAQCVLVLAEFRHASATAVFARARSIVRDVDKGRYTDGNRTKSAADQLRLDSPVWGHSDKQALTDWQEMTREANDFRSDDRLAFVADGLDPVIRAGLSAEMTQVQIAEMIGRSPSYVCKRINEIREACCL